MKAKAYREKVERIGSLLVADKLNPFDLFSWVELLELKGEMGSLGLDLDVRASVNRMLDAALVRKATSEDQLTTGELAGMNICQKTIQDVIVDPNSITIDK